MRMYLLLFLVLAAACTTESTVHPRNVSTDARNDLLDSGNDARATLEELLVLASGEYVVNWTIVQSGSNASAQMTMHTQGTRLRFDTWEEGRESRTIITDKEAVACVKAESWDCYRLAATERSLPRSGKYGNLTGIDVEVARTRSILGIRAACFLMHRETETEEACYSPEGVPLLIEITTPTGTMTQKASGFWSTVPAEAFEPPARPAEIPGKLTPIVGGPHG